MTRLSLPKLFAVVAVSTAIGAGCLGSAVTNGGDPNSPDAGVGQDGSVTPPDMAVDVKADFEKNVQPLLVADCGVCHSQVTGGTGPGFLSANPDIFTTVTSYPGLIGATPETSRILIKDNHEAGKSYSMSPELADHAKVISDWIVEFNAHGGVGGALGLDMSAKARIEPFVPAAGNKQIDLGLLDPAFSGVMMSFDVTMIGSTQIELSNIQIKATATTGVHVKSPVFAKYDAADINVAVDIDYDYLNKDFSAGPGGTIVFDPSLTFTTYNSGQLINVSFNLLETSAGGADMGGMVTGCKDLTAFNTFMSNLTTTITGMNNACASGGCHGQSGGVGGLNLNGISMNNQTVCNSVLNNVIISNPATSPIYLHPTDGTSHAGGKITTADGGTTRMNYLTAVTTFANAQK